MLILFLFSNIKLHRNRTTKSGTLPNLTFVARKPRPLGTEFKCIADGMSGCMLWLEIQEGKENMKKKDYQREMGATTAFVLRGARDLRDSDTI